MPAPDSWLFGKEAAVKPPPPDFATRKATFLAEQEEKKLRKAAEKAAKEAAKFRRKHGAPNTRPKAPASAEVPMSPPNDPTC